MGFTFLGYSAVIRGALNSYLGMMRAQRTPGETDQAGVGVRIAVYPGGGTPEITEVSASDPGSATRKFTRFVSEKVREARGRVPEESIREVVENLIHADYRGQHRWRYRGHNLRGRRRGCYRRKGGCSTAPAETVPRRSTADEHFREAAEGSNHGTRVR